MLPHFPSPLTKMSLINRQMLIQAKSDRDDVLHRLSVGEDTQKVKDLLAGATKRVAKLEKDIAQEEAKAVADRKAAQEKADAAKTRNVSAAGRRPYEQRTERAPLPENIELPCVDCGSGFSFTGKDQVFFQKQGWSQPSRCADCRDAKKSEKPAGSDLTCGDCETTFFFSDAKARIFEEKGWEQPKRCHDCSVAHKNMGPLLVNCDGCSKGFSFSVKAQKDYKVKGWSAPKRCRDCRLTKKEKQDAAPVQKEGETV